MLKGRGGKAVRVGLLLLAIGGLVAAVVASGVTGYATDEDRLRATVEGAGIYGPIVFVGLMTVLVPLNVPGVLFVLPSTALFGTPGGIALSLLGGFLASVVGMVAARQVGRAAFEGRLPRRVQRLEARLVAQGFWAIAGIRSVTFLLQPVDWVCGFSTVPMRTAITGTFVGLVPPTLVLCLFGRTLLGVV